MRQMTKLHFSQPLLEANGPAFPCGRRVLSSAVCERERLPQGCWKSSRSRSMEDCSRVCHGARSRLRTTTITTATGRSSTSTASGGITTGTITSAIDYERCCYDDCFECYYPSTMTTAAATMVTAIGTVTVTAASVTTTTAVTAAAPSIQGAPCLVSNRAAQN